MRSSINAGFKESRLLRCGSAAVLHSLAQPGGAGGLKRA